MCTCCSMTNGICDLGLPPEAALPDPPIALPDALRPTSAAVGASYPSKWGDPFLGASGGTVTWSLVAAGESMADLGVGLSVDPEAALAFDVLAVVERAFDAWEAAADVEFLRIEDPGGDLGESALADIRLFHGSISPGYFKGFAFPVYRRNGDVPAEAGDINMNPAGLDEASYYRILLHEIGHSLGLGHVDQGQVSIMTPRVVTNELSVSDVALIQSIYGAPRPALPVYHMPKGERTIRVLEEADGLTIEGNRLSNRIEGTGANELFEGGTGNDTLLGGGGLDTAVVDIARADAVVNFDLAATNVSGAGIDTDRLIDIERIAFADGLLALDTEASALGFVARLYTAAFGREADAGVLFWQEAFLDGLSERALAAAFVESQEFADLYGAAPTDEAYVRALFSAVLERPPDPNGLEFWTVQLASGRSREEMLIAFSESPENVAANARSLADGLFFEGDFIG